MAVQDRIVVDECMSAPRDEAGTAPEDRAFRPDVEGLRAVAVGLVVLYHASVPGLTGGYVGVDVFFVISGFVITGLLLRERAASGRTSVLHFYARRVRRILPAATLVLVVAVAATFLLLGVVSGIAAADDARWTTVFLANFHFSSLGTSYLAANRPPSPLQNYWSLSVEEQFYVAYPTLFLLVAGARRFFTLRLRLTVFLVVVIGASYWWSVAQTSAHPGSAYFSPFTRAWELALGALVAVCTPWLRTIPSRLAALLGWTGFTAIAASAFAFDAHTPYPGSLVALPVVGGAIVIAAGTAIPGGGAERLLGLRSFQGLGRLSYSLYLWHWPILVIAAESAGKTSLPVGESFLLILLATAAAATTYRLLENPVRHWRLPSGRSVAFGVALALTTVLIMDLVTTTDASTGPAVSVKAAPSAAVLFQDIQASARLTAVPRSIQPALTSVRADWGGNYVASTCQAAVPQPSEQICPLGDPHGRKLMVLVGDSHAQMWIPAFAAVARAAHWRLVTLTKSYCPVEPVSVANWPTWPDPGGPFTTCNAFRAWAVNWINIHQPNLLVITQENFYLAARTNGSPPGPFTPAQWRAGLDAMFRSFRLAPGREVFLGNIPRLARGGANCPSEHPSAVQLCAAQVKTAVEPLNPVDKAAVLAHRVRYIDTVPWLCATTCPDIVGHYLVYWDTIHITATWAKYLKLVLWQALQPSLAK